MQLDESFGHWLAGFIDGEGSFNIQKNGRGAVYCNFRLALHYDDLAILTEIQTCLGFGTLWTGHPASQYGGRASWTVQSKTDCLRLVELLEQFPLRAKKRRDFEIWKQAVKAWQGAFFGGQGVTAPWRPTLARLRNELCSGRARKGKSIWQ